ncbi:hypothetical protein DBR06_SOUSAS7510031, partial [Sousa chinensis]
EYQDLQDVNTTLIFRSSPKRKLLEGKENRVSLPLPNFSSLKLRETILDSLLLVDSHSKWTILIKKVKTRDRFSTKLHSIM